MLYCTFSNRVEVLAAALKKALWGENTGPLEERLIILPSQAMKRFLMMNLVDDFNVAMGLKFPYLDKAIKSLLPLSFPCKNDLSFLIEKEIEKRLEQPGLCELLSEMHITADTLAQTGVRHALAGFADTLADLFLLYGLFAGPLVEEWFKKGPDDWQSEIFVEIYKNPKRGFPYRALQYAPQKRLNIHIFCPSFIPKVWLKFFSHVDARIYALSTTAHAGYDHPLLAAWGRGEREFVISLEQLEARTARVYQVPEALSQEDFLTEDVFFVEEPATGLKSVQASLLLQSDEKPFADDTLTIHSYDSQFAEVEGLYSRLASLVEHKKIALKDIVIMAPQISEYAPYVDAVFNHASSGLPVQFFDTKGPSGSLEIQGFLDILALGENRCALSDFEKILCNPVLQTDLSKQDIHNFLSMMTEIGLTWGLDADDRQSWHAKNYGSAQPFAKRIEGTWQDCFRRLFDYALRTPSSRFWYDLSLVEKGYQFFAEIRNFLKIMRGGEEKRLSEWGTWLLDVARSYFEDISSLESSLKNIVNSQELFTVPFAALYPRLLNLLCGENEVYGDQNKLDVISACSLLPMRAVPSRIICLLGLSLEKFPRRQAPLALDKREGRKDLDYAPTKAEFDRMLFLETVLSARDYLLMSYRATGEDAQESLVLSELREYVELQVINGKPQHLAFSRAQEKDFYIKKEQRKEEPTLALLTAAIRNPLKLFYQKSMGIYLSEGKKEKKSFLTNYEKAFIENRSLKVTESLLIDELIQKGHMPPGALSAVMKKQVEDLYQSVDHALHHFSLAREEIQTLHFVKGLESSFQEGSHIFVPALLIGNRHLEGKVRGVSSKGLISFKEKSLESLAPEWPLWMAFSYYNQNPGSLLLFKEREVLAGKTLKNWEALLAYYDYCLHQPVALFPSLIKPLLNGEEAPFEGDDPYFKLYISSAEKSSLQEVRPLIKEIYGEEASCL